MIASGTTTLMRPAKPSHREWLPLASGGQLEAANFLVEKRLAALWADPGAGKTSITLRAFSLVQAMWQGRKPKMLVVCTKRILQLVWAQEAAGWSEFRHLQFAKLHGPKKDKILRESFDADVFLVTYAGLQWLATKFKGQWPFDVVACDESTRIKNHTAKQSKTLRDHTQATPFKWELTGTPNPNGYEDLFGQFLWLDPAILGRFKSHFLDKYFKRGFNGFDWDLQTGGAERIEARIEPYVYRLPYTDLPPFSVDIRRIELEPDAKKTYRNFRKENLEVFGVHKVTAKNAGALQSKLAQMANGAVYDDAKTGYILIHDQKLDALEELIDEMNGQPLLVAYEFRHDIARFRERFGKLKGVAFFDDATTEAKAQKLQDDWNAGKISVLFAHPASMGHGLNLQRGGASHICWFSIHMDYELWDQFIRRIWRQGNPADRIVNHVLVVSGTIDELKLALVDDKGVEMAQLLQAVERLLTDDLEENQMNNPTRLGHQADAPGGWGPPAAAAPAAPAANNGWGAPPPAAAPPANNGGWGAPPMEERNNQAQQVEQKINAGAGWGAPQQNAAPAAPPPPATAGWGGAAPAASPGMQHFSANVQQAVAGEAPAAADTTQTQAPGGWGAPPPAAAPADKPKRTRNTASKDQTAAAVDQVNKGGDQEYAGAKFHQAAFNGEGLTINISGSADTVMRLIRAMASA